MIPYQVVEKLRRSGAASGVVGGGLVDVRRSVRGVVVEDEYRVRGTDYRRLRGRVRAYGACVIVETVQFWAGPGRGGVGDGRWVGSGAWWPVGEGEGASE